MWVSVSTSEIRSLKRLAIELLRGHFLGGKVYVDLMCL